MPKLVVFYNGSDERPEAEDLNLSDAFPPELREASDIQVRVRMLNVNLGKSETLLDDCNPWRNTPGSSTRSGKTSMR